MITLNELKKIIYNDTTAPHNIDFLTTFLPSVLYNHPDQAMNINLINSEYKLIAGWLSYLMNGKTSLSDNRTVTRSGVERVRNQMLSILLKNQDALIMMENNCKNFILQHPIDQNLLTNLIKSDSKISEPVKRHLEKCIDNYLPHGLTLLFLYAIFPNHVKKLTNLKYWQSSNSLSNIRLNRPQYNIVLSLQKQLGSLISEIKESCGLGEEINDRCLDQLIKFDDALRIHALDVPPEFFQYFNMLLDFANRIYYQLYPIPNPPCPPATILAYKLQEIIKLQQAYDLFCSNVNELTIEEKEL